MRRFLFAAFFLSGFTGLVYEAVWARYLGLLVGHGAYGQVAVLALFLGGLALGALLVGRISEGIRRPLLFYGAVEMALGLYGLAFHPFYRGVESWAREVLLPAAAAAGILPSAQAFLAALLVLPPATLLGTTLPLISAGLLRRDPEKPGRTLALLYFHNSLGAAVGAPVAGFVLLAHGGLPGALRTAGLMNLAIGGAVLAAVGLSAAGPRPREAPRGTGSGEGASRGEKRGSKAASRRGGGAPNPWRSPAWAEAGDETRIWRLLLAVSFTTAAASFIYEIAWIRMLSLVLGAATHAFELMLSAFILGLALGAFWIRTRADRFRDPFRVLGWIQWAMGLAALATLPVYLLSFEAMEALFAVVRRTAPGYLAFNGARYGFALAVMLPATFCAGAVLPLITRILLATPRGEGAVGWVYGLNTAGAIAGVLAASLILLPGVGLRNLLLLGGGIDMVLGAILLGGVGRGRTRRGGREGGVALAGAAVVVVAFASTVEIDRALLASGVFRHGSAASPGEVLYYADGRTATVTVVERSDGSRTIATNGKVDASLGDRWIRWSEARADRRGEDALPPLPDATTAPLELDEATQALLGLVPLAHQPDARRAAVVGHGSGVTSHMLLAAPGLEEVVTLEIEEAMVEGSRRLGPANRRVFEDPRSRIVLRDARSYFATERERFDLIVSAPSNPWVRGVSSLFTVEFYEAVARRLDEGGVFGQWLQLYEIDDDLVLHVLAALHRVFPSYHAFRLQDGDLVVVATLEDELPDPSWQVFELPEAREDLALTEPFTPSLLEALRVLERRALAPLLDSGPRPHSDFVPLLDLGAERTRFLGRRAEGVLAAGAPNFHPADPFRRPLAEAALADLPGRSPVPGVPRLRALVRTARVRALFDEGVLFDGGDGDAGSAGRDALESSGELDHAPSIYGYRRFRKVLEADERPVSWEAWTWDALEAVRLFHDGLDLAPDHELFGALEAYLERWDAPAAPRAAVDFVRGLVGRSWSRSAEATPVLARELEEGREWISPQLLLDGGTIALLLAGSPQEARAHRQRVRNWVARPPSDLRSRLLTAYLEAAEEGTLPLPVDDSGR